jgi:hypothetical protein
MYTKEEIEMAFNALVKDKDEVQSYADALIGHMDSIKTTYLKSYLFPFRAQVANASVKPLFGGAGASQINISLRITASLNIVGDDDISFDGGRLNSDTICNDILTGKTPVQSLARGSDKDYYLMPLAVYFNKNNQELYIDTEFIGDVSDYVDEGMLSHRLIKGGILDGSLIIKPRKQ